MIAVIFTSQRTPYEHEEYQVAAARMDGLASKQVGFIRLESVRDATGKGITVSYWTDLDAVKRWKAQEEHLCAQAKGRSDWYENFQIEICEVRHAKEFHRQRVASDGETT